MYKTYSDIGPLEKKVLQDQYETSPFFINNKDATKPTQLEIFDFDSTLFLSPSLSPSIWHSSLIQQLVGEDVFGPGWWKDYRSLDLGPIDELEKSQWKNYWNEDIVSQARRSLADPTVMTVLLTGRRAIPFCPLISRILASKQLHFDLLGLRPDPTKETHDDYINNNNNNNNNSDTSSNDTSYGASSVFVNTLDFKTCFILNILHNVPSINKIIMWDDRAPHVKKFQQFLDALTYSQRLITYGSAKHVTPVRPYYRPKWERRIVAHVLESHNANELLYREKQQWNRDINMITWEAQHFLDDEQNHNDDTHHHPPHCLTKVAKHLSLGYIPSSTIVRLDQSSVNKLREAFEPFYSVQLKKNNQELTGWRAKAEIPLWFGHQIILFTNVHDHRRLESYGGLGMKVKFVVRSISQPDPQLGMVALVDIYPDLGTNHHHNDNNGPPGFNNPKKFILPLMYKPSQSNTISRKTFQWIRVPSRHHLHHGFGEISHSHLLGLDGTVKDDGEHQLVCLDPETKSTVLGKRASIDLIDLS